MTQFDSLTEKQMIAAENYVDNSIAHQRDKSIKKMTQEDLGETVGVTGRTIRNWMNDTTFLAYIHALSMKRLQQSAPAFAGVLIRNLERGDNVSTKQLDLIAKLDDRVPQGKSGGDTYNQITYNGSIDEIQSRIDRINARKEAEVVSVQEEEPDE